MESPQNRQFIYTTNWGVLPEIFWRTGAIFLGVVILPHFPARPVGMVGGSVETPKAPSPLPPSRAFPAAYGGWPLDAPAGAVRPAALLRPQAHPGATAVGGS